MMSEPTEEERKIWAYGVGPNSLSDGTDQGIITEAEYQRAKRLVTEYETRRKEIRVSQQRERERRCLDDGDHSWYYTNAKWKPVTEQRCKYCGAYRK